MIRKKLLVVDDDPAIGRFISEVAGEIGFKTKIATNTGEFVRAYTDDASVIILDLLMPGADGVEHLRFLSDGNCSAAILLISGFDVGVLRSTEKLAIERGLRVIGSLQKPFGAVDLRNALNAVSLHAPSQPGPFVQPPGIRELAVAINNSDITVHYQPQFDIKNRDLIGVEALARWHHPHRGLIGPDVFVPMAENSGLIDDLTMVVLDQSLRQCAKWSAAGLYTRVSVNMSARSLARLDVPERIMAKIEGNRLEPRQLVLEVTESGLMQELVTSLDILTRLRMKGIQLSIDDFGTGYSSMAQLHKLPFSELKIDHSFVALADTDEEARTIIDTTIMLGHRLGMTVVAEGVETAPVLDILADFNCDIAQGFLLGRPEPAADVLNGIRASLEKEKPVH